MRGALFESREDAGRALAAAVSELFAARPEMTAPVVLALPRGGVPVAVAVARALGAPLDLVMVRKIGVPYQPELAAAAVVDGDDPQLVTNPEVVRLARVSSEALAAGKARALAEIARRRETYLRGRAPVAIAGRDAVLVDDGVATGATMRAALEATRAKGARTLTLAIPVAPPDTVARLARETDHLICLSQPTRFYAIGAHYRDFRQVSDEEVVRLLAEAASSQPGGGSAADPDAR